MRKIVIHLICFLITVSVGQEIRPYKDIPISKFSDLDRKLFNLFENKNRLDTEEGMEEAKRLLDQGANPNVYDVQLDENINYSSYYGKPYDSCTYITFMSKCWTVFFNPVFLATRLKKDKELLELLFEYGADPNVLDGERKTLISYVYDKSGMNNQFVNYLVKEKHVNILQKYSDGRSFGYYNPEVASVYGYDFNEEIISKCSSFYGKEKTISIIDKIKNMVSNYNNPSYKKSFYRILETVKFLLENGANPLIKDSDGKICFDYGIDIQDSQYISIKEKYLSLWQNYKVAASLGTPPNNLSLNKHAIFTASSTLESKNNIYLIEKLLDGNNATAWVEGVFHNGLREYIELKVDSAFSDNFKRVYLLNGYTKSPSIWKENSRVKQFGIYQDNELKMIVDLKDTDEWQYFDLLDVIDKNKPIQFWILAVYDGTKYKDTAISELVLKDLENVPVEK